jgi:hypothetical protein
MFARLRCPACAETHQLAELARDHYSPFVLMSVADIFEEAIMWVNRMEGRRERGRSGATRQCSDTRMICHSPVGT